MNKNMIIITPHGEDINYEFKEIDALKLEFDRSEIQHSESYIYEWLETQKSNFNQIDGFIISCKCDWENAIKMILFLRLVKKWNLDECTIIWDSKKEFIEILNANLSFVPNENTVFIDRRMYSTTEVNQEIESHFINSKNIPPFDIEQITVKPYKSSGHQITNEWGAYKLAHTAEFYDLLPKIEEKQKASKTLYFNYLKRKYKINEQFVRTKPNIPLPNTSPKYLLIDDNYDKGWHLVFSEILKQTTLGLDAFEKIDDFKKITEINPADVEAIIDEIKEEIKTKNYQGVLLDLRLHPSDDEKGKSHTDINNFTGGRILKAIKEEFPFLPVIMVTASNKAWNMRQLLDAGADGYFIKEDPESNPSKDVSESSYEAFKDLIEASKKKYKTLQPFWEHIKENKTNSLIQERTDTNGVSTKVKERIDERLKMFFGLLKRSFEDTKYNQQFHYSDKALAFMTLWSCLNDLQFIYLIKKPISETSKNHEITIVPYLVSHLSIPPEYGILTRQKVSEGEPTNSLEAFFKEDWTTTKTFNIPNSSISISDWKKVSDRSKSIGDQIAILINAFSFTDIPLKQKLLKQLFDLKVKRNALYLIHGEDDDLSKDFYKKLEKGKTEISEQDCAQLFEIVYFLLKGIYVQINV